MATGGDHRSARTASSLRFPTIGLGAYCSRPPPLGGHRGNPTDACKVSLARRAARIQAPRWRCGQRCRGPPGDLSTAIPTLPALAPGRGTHSPSACCWPSRAGGVQRGLVAACTAAGRDRVGRGSPDCALTVVVVAGTAFQTALTPLFWLRLMPQPGVLFRSRQEPVPGAQRLRSPAGESSS